MENGNIAKTRYPDPEAVKRYQEEVATILKSMIHL